MACGSSQPQSSERKRVPKKPVLDQEARRKRALIVFQLIIYSILVIQFSIQMYLYSTRDW